VSELLYSPVVGILVGGCFVTIWVGLVVWAARRCWHQWEKGEVREYPAPISGGFTATNIDENTILRLHQSYTTYVQRCKDCGIERYHTEVRPD
jgi:hypothetical protein